MALWRDPEEFLDFVESAIPGSAAAALLSALGDAGDPATIADIGRRALAIECSHFLRGANPNTERWLPYRMWASGLCENDTVVTFNYDRIPDLLSLGSRLRVMVPDRNLEQTLSKNRASKAALVLKLHGSVDWVEVKGDVTVDPEIDLPTRCAKGTDLVMAIPGPGKWGLRERAGMDSLWAQAGKAIRNALRIIFVGYRFPPTDVQARVEILGAIKDAAKGPLQLVKIVLGPDDRHPDIARMKKLLSYVVHPDLVEVVPLYAEDFLSLDK